MPRIDVLHYDIRVEIIPQETALKGEAKVRFRVKTESVSIPFQLNSRLTVLDVRDETGQEFSTGFDRFDSSHMLVRGPRALAPGVEKTLTFRFEGNLENEQYAFLNTPRAQRAVVGPKGALLLNPGYWFPSHQLGLDAASAVFRVSVPLGFSVVAPGRLESIQTEGVNEVFTWKSDEALTQFPVVVARFFRQRFDDGPVPITFFVSENFKQDPKVLAGRIGELFEFFSREYSLVPVDHLTVAEVGNVVLPDSGSRGLLLLESRFLKSLPEFEMARRVARQWWGYSLRPRGAADAWLGDAFANYAALRYFEVKHPDQFSSQLVRQAVEALKYESQAPISKGVALKPGSPPYQSVVASKGAWVLYMLSQLVGRETFNNLVVDWYQEKAGHAAGTEEWIQFVNQNTGKDYRWFFAQWVQSTGVPRFEVDYIIYKLRDGSFKIRGHVKQNLDLFRMPLDLEIKTKGANENKKLNIRGKSTAFSFHTQTQPLRIDFDPHGKILSHSRRMQIAVHIALGEEHREAGDSAAAIREFDKAVKLDPRSSMAHYDLGLVFFEQQNLSSAANSFRDALNGDLKPKWVETWSHIYLGNVYDILGNRQRALAEYQKALNTKIDYRGAQAKAQQYIQKAYVQKQSVIVEEEKP